MPEFDYDAALAEPLRPSKFRVEMYSLRIGWIDAGWTRPAERRLPHIAREPEWEPWLFGSEEEAQTEIKVVCGSNGFDPSEYRVVPVE